MTDLFADTLQLTAKPAPAAPAYVPQGLQERAARFGCETLADFEALELLLSRTAPKVAANHAKALLGRYLSLGAVLAAPTNALAQMVGSAAALDLKLVHEATRRVMEEKIARRCVVSSPLSGLGWGLGLLVGLEKDGLAVRLPRDALGDLRFTLAQGPRHD